MRSSVRRGAVAAVLAWLACGGSLAAQETVLPVDRPAETPPQSETAPPAAVPASRPDAAGDTPPVETRLEEPPAAGPDGPAEPPAAEAPADAASSGTPPPAEGPTARPEIDADPPLPPASLIGVPEPVLALHVSTTFCEDPSGPPLAGHAALVAALSPTAVLVGIPCSGDADRAAFRLYVLETGEIGGVHAQFFALPSKSLGWTGTDVLWSPAVDAEGVLTGTLYDPGEGRCMSRGRWAWTGYALAMRTAEIDDGCGGGGGWRTVYP